MEEVNKLHHSIQATKVQSTVRDATSMLEKSGDRTGGVAAVSGEMRTALEKEVSGGFVVVLRWAPLLGVRGLLRGNV